MEKILLEPCSLEYFNTETMRGCHKYAMRMLKDGRAIEVIQNGHTYLKLLSDEEIKQRKQIH